jgi:flagellar motor switch/type III secretory pathway protein FliN
MATKSPDDPNAAALAAEPVKLTFELGDLTIAAGELALLDAGFVFPLRAPLDRPVVVKANGVRFGVGELVEIDGALAVRLAEGDGDGS